MSFQIEKIKPRQAFLIDSCGALISAIMLYFVLSPLESVFGMPQKALSILAAIAAIFCLYSFLCYGFNVKNTRLFLSIIAIANLIYVCISLGFMFIFYQKLTLLGFAYFIGEKIIVLFLALIEWKIARY